jgi:hypothetical protein
MTPHQLGRRLRDQLLSDQRQGRGFDPRRLQGVIADLCSGELSDLVVPLRYLVLSNAFASAAGQDPPLADARLLARLEDELAQMYAEPVCRKLRPVLEGLLGQPEGLQSAAAAGGPASAPAAAAPAWQAPASPPAAAAPTAAPRNSQTALNGVLAFLSGVLLMGLAAMGVLLWQRQQSPGLVTAPAPPSAAGQSAPQPPAAVPAAASPPPPDPAPAATPLSPASAALPDRAVTGIQALYSALSAKDFAQARSLFGPAAADQFDPGFFQQFERVTVQDLRTTGEAGSTVNLEGLVTFVWPDGSLQTETRSFSVDTASDPPLITASEFGRVVRPR